MRYTNFRFPDAPEDWSPSAKERWYQLISSLQANMREQQARQKRPSFVVQGVVTAETAPVTVNTTSGTLLELYRIVVYILNELETAGLIHVKK